MNKNILNEVNRNREIMGLSPILIEQEELTRKERRQQRRADKNQKKPIKGPKKKWRLEVNFGELDVEGVIDLGRDEFFAEQVGLGKSSTDVPVTYNIKINSAAMGKPQSH